MKKQAFLIAAHYTSERIIESYTNICDATSVYGETFLLYHQKNDSKPDQLLDVNIHIFTDDVLYQLGYKPLGDKLLPGSNHFSLLQFFLENPQFELYWYIESDVIFNGNWKYLFKMFNGCKSDFISSYLEHNKDNPTWPWWRTLQHPSKYVPTKFRIRSFNPIYRISHSALSFIHRSLLNQWRGHHEVLLPTLLYHNSYKIVDFGGEGAFVQPGFTKKFYTSKTFRWRPVFSKPGKQKNKLYHPVKS